LKHLAQLNKYFFKYKYHLFWGTVFVTLSNIFAIIPAQIVRHSFDLVKNTLEIHTLFKGTKSLEALSDQFARGIFIYGGLILVMALLRGVFLFLMRQTLIVMSRHIEFDQKNEIYNHYQALSLSFYRRNNTGDLMARISEDVSKVRMYTGPAIMYAINLIVLFVLVIAYMISVNTTLTLYALLPLPLLSISIYFVNNIINRRSEEIQRSLSNLSTFVQEAFSGIRVLKAYRREADSGHTFEAESNEYLNKSLKLTNVNALFFPLVTGLIGLSTILTVYVGGILVNRGEITTGNIAEFVIYINMLTWPVTSLGWVTSIIQRAAASQERINAFLFETPEILPPATPVRDITGNLQFRDVSLTYPESGIKALKNIDFELKSGQSLAIVGGLGSGKSTIANMICRLYDPTTGEVILDGENMQQVNLHTLRENVAYVPQDVFLFSDTIIKNIAFGKDDATQEEIAQAATWAGVYDNIMAFPKGFETIIGERGITLSGGQKQRVAIARALIRQPKILILDDCLSAVDTHTENEILNHLKTLMANRSTLIISHRISSVKLADRILVLDQGEIIEQGTHEELMKLNGAYREIYDKQLLVEEAV